MDCNWIGFIVVVEFNRRYLWDTTTATLNGIPFLERKVYQKVTPQGQRTDAKNLKTNYWGDVLEMGDKLQISTGRIFFEQQTELVDYPANLFFFHIPGLTCTSRTTHHRNLMAPPPKSPPRKYKAVLRENTPPWKRTWQCKHHHLKMYLLWRMVICHCHISFRGVLGKLLPQIDPFPRSKRSTLWAVASSPGVNLQCVHFV